VQAETIALDLGEVIPLSEKGMRIPVPKRGDAAASPWAHEGGGCWLLSVHYAERPVSPVQIVDPCSCERDEWDQVCETVRYSLRWIGDCRKCCLPHECELKCGCGTGPCCEPPKREPVPTTQHERPRLEGVLTADRSDTQPIGDKKGYPVPAPAGHERPVFERGGCRCLCEHLTNLPIVGDGGPLYEIEEPCGRVRVDLHYGVPLACVKLKKGECGWEFDSIYDDCGPRRLVKRNDLLFDLVRGCDLTRIADIGWRTWHRHPKPIEFDDFYAGFGSDAGEDPAMLTKKFWVRFSRPVRKETVTPDAFAMTVIVAERDDGWGEARRVPIVRIDSEPLANDEPEGHVSKATLVVRKKWFQQALKGLTLFDRDRGRVEIEVRGDYIIDCNGQAVDANAHGLQALPTGNGTPGGTFFSTFRVERRRPAATVPDSDDEV
jgi:hypothetical protein